MYWIFPYLCIRNELFDSIAPQNAENRTVANSLLLFLKCSVKCLFLKWLCQTVENLKYVATLGGGINKTDPLQIQVSAKVLAPEQGGYSWWPITTPEYTKSVL